ncbi:MAG: aldo/keto reductase [Proteobacteria bacterium]|nr:aldo/keto reductase [Pseudomonadota bacterium]
MSAISRARVLEGLAALAASAALPAAAVAQSRPAAPEARMLTRPIPSSGEAMPVIGLGTWQTFDVARNPAIKPQLRQVLDIFFAGGGRMIDSSPMYGSSEAVTGELLSERVQGPKAFLATKVWTSGKDQGIAQMRESAQLLRSKVIDLMQIHNLVDWQTHLATLRRMKEQGQIRYLGITHYTTGSLPDLARILERERIDFVQLGYSIETRDAEARVLKLCAERGVAVIVNQPFEQGSLFRKVRGKALPEWAAAFDCASWAQFFLKYLVGHPAVTCVIPATDKPDHMKDNVLGGHGTLPDAKQRQAMAKFWDGI